jgi:hypothetical protein
MATLTEMVAAVVVHSSVAAFSHFGVMLEPERVEKPQPAAERVIARTPRKTIQKLSTKLADCPEQRQVQTERAPVEKA